MGCGYGTLHQQNVFPLLEAPRSVWEDVECKLRSINFRRVSDPRRAFCPALGVTGISDDWYRSTMGVIVISLGTRQSAGENFGCTWECRWTNLAITNNLWEMPGFLWVLIWRTASVIWDSPGIHKQSISLKGYYDARIIVYHHFWIILAIIFFNIVFFASLHQRTKGKGYWSKPKRRYTKTITQLSNQMIAIKYRVNVIHSIFHLIRANKSRNAPFINGAKNLEVLLVFADYLYLASGWNWIPMSFGMICNI